MNSEKNDPYLALTGELWGVFSEFSVEKISRDIETALYLKHNWAIVLFLYKQESRKHLNPIGDHFVYASSQWETTLQCNVVSHWLGAYTKWSLSCAMRWMDPPHNVISWLEIYTSAIHTCFSENRLKQTHEIWFRFSSNLIRPQCDVPYDVLVL